MASDLGRLDRHGSVQRRARDDLPRADGVGSSQTRLTTHNRPRPARAGGGPPFVGSKSACILRVRELRLSFGKSRERQHQERFTLHTSGSRSNRSHHHIGLYTMREELSELRDDVISHLRRNDSTVVGLDLHSVANIAGATEAPGDRARLLSHLVHAEDVIESSGHRLAQDNLAGGPTEVLPPNASGHLLVDNGAREIQEVLVGARAQRQYSLDNGLVVGFVARV